MTKANLFLDFFSHNFLYFLLINGYCWVLVHLQTSLKEAVEMDSTKKASGSFEMTSSILSSSVISVGAELSPSHLNLLLAMKKATLTNALSLPRFTFSQHH